MKARIACLSLLFALGCHTADSSSGADGISPAVRLADWMTGTFSSAQQAEESPDAFFDIRLFMVPIWTERDDGPWLYIEQAAATALERPYRQRVYHLVETKDGVRSDVYELPGDPLEYAGAWREPGRFDAFGPPSLSERLGCSIYMIEREGAFVGSTKGRECGSTLGGALYATSAVHIEPDLLTSWDRGWDDGDQQVWGAELGPYHFVRHMETEVDTGASN